MTTRMTQLKVGRRALLGGAAGAAVMAGTAAARGPARSAPRPQAVTSGPLLLNMLAVPARVYDSRPVQPPNGTNPYLGGGDVPLAGNTTVTIDCVSVLGDTMAPTGVPLGGAEALLLNVTAINTVGSNGYLKVWAAGASEPAISSLNWFQPSATVANAVTTRCSGSGQISIMCGGAVGCSTNLFVDVLGYYSSFVV